MVTSLNPGDDSAKRKEDDTNDTNDSKRNRRFRSHLKGGNPAAVVDILQTSFTGIGMNSV